MSRSARRKSRPAFGTRSSAYARHAFAAHAMRSQTPSAHRAKPRVRCAMRMRDFAPTKSMRVRNIFGCITKRSIATIDAATSSAFSPSMLSSIGRSRSRMKMFTFTNSAARRRDRPTAMRNALIETCCANAKSTALRCSSTNADPRTMSYSSIRKVECGISIARGCAERLGGDKRRESDWQHVAALMQASPSVPLEQALHRAILGKAPTLLAALTLPGLGRFDVAVRRGHAAVDLHLRCSAATGYAWLRARRDGLERRLAHRLGCRVRIWPMLSTTSGTS